MTKSFLFFLDERSGIVKRGTDSHSWALASTRDLTPKEIRPGGQRLPPCLCIIAIMALLVKDADKLSFGQSLTITMPHAIEGYLNSSPLTPSGWLTNTRMTHYQSLLLTPPPPVQAPTSLTQLPCCLSQTLTGHRMTAQTFCPTSRGPEQIFKTPF